MRVNEPEFTEDSTGLEEILDPKIGVGNQEFLEKVGFEDWL